MKRPRNVKKKQLVKQTRDIPDEVLRRQVEQSGRTAADYHLYDMGRPGEYLVVFRDKNGAEFVVMAAASLCTAPARSRRVKKRVPPPPIMGESEFDP